jgi:lipopolysaccharide/colanic/teichoic acid biosynthesis glycosyltransferase
VRLSSPGPILYRQRRVGRDGTLFDLYKFRSMHVDELDRLDRRDKQKAANGLAANGDASQPALALAAPALASSALDASLPSTLDEIPPTPLSGDDITAFEFMLGGDTAPGGVEGPDRRTLIGRILRRTSIDELPQLFNVLRGEMSLIGPRPERPEFVELFRQDIARYGERHRVKSGITGWAQVHGLRGQTSLAERVEWDNYYIAHWSLGLDLKILALTFGALFRNAE